MTAPTDFSARATAPEVGFIGVAALSDWMGQATGMRPEQTTALLARLRPPAP